MRLSPWVVAVSVMVVPATHGSLAAAQRWEPVKFRGTPPTTYTYERLADGLALRADSRRSASGLVFELPQELEPAAISWRWRLERCVDNAQENERAGDDFAARVFVLFGRRSWTPFGWFRRQLFQGPFGRITPKRALSYVWASHATRGDVAFSPWSSDVFQIVARAGCREDTNWVTERFDLDRDFARAFREPTPHVVALAVMTDTDDTSGHAVAWYGEVVLHLQAGGRVSLPFDSD